jgi:transcriptional regulator with XRE-family HTH domain
MDQARSRLHDYRKKHGITLQVLGEALGVEKGHLSRIERGQVWPSRDFFERLVELTNGEVTANDFVAPPAPAAEEATP